MQHAWADLPDTELLKLRICDLHVRIEGSEVEERVRQLHHELEARGLPIKPSCYLGDEWFSPEGSPVIGIPFYLAHPRLKQLELHQMLEVEGGTQEWCMQILRHECGHAYDHAYQFSAREDWAEVFGDPSIEYEPDTYRPRPYSKSFVRHLPNWYAQAHPDEDFAETFAVWLSSPMEQWGSQYRGWKALRKLEYMESLMKHAQSTPPLVVKERRLWEASRSRRTLEKHYAAKRKLYAEDFPDIYDADLRAIFEKGEAGEENAAQVMQRLRRALIASVGRWTGQRKYIGNELVSKLISRCRELGLRAPRDQTRLLIDLASYMAALVTNHLHTGRYQEVVLMKVLVLFDLPRPVGADETFTMKALREEEDRPTEADVIRALGKLGHQVETLAVYDNTLAVVEKVRDYAPAVVFNLCESFFNERSNEPNIPALLELLRVPYTGAGPDSMLLCKDKALAKAVLGYHRIRVPRFVMSRKRSPRRSLRRFSFPTFVKPVGEESSDGISKASFGRNEKETIERAHFLHEKLGCDVMIEEYVEGRELYISVLGNRRVSVLPTRELFFGDLPETEPRFATFRAKWDDAYRSKWGIRNGAVGALPPEVEKKLPVFARRVTGLLKITGTGRLDVRLKPTGELVFIEANPNPSLARGDDFARSAAAAGIDFETLVQRILDHARSKWDIPAAAVVTPS